MTETKHTVPVGQPSAAEAGVQADDTAPDSSPNYVQKPRMTVADLLPQEPASPSSPDAPERTVREWAKAKGVSDFDLAGAAVLAGWPRGNLSDPRAPLMVTEADFDKAIDAFRNLEMK
jgi:hypothetical protein